MRNKLLNFLRHPGDKFLVWMGITFLVHCMNFRDADICKSLEIGVELHEYIFIGAHDEPEFHPVVVVEVLHCFLDGGMGDVLYR